MLPLILSHLSDTELAELLLDVAAILEDGPADQEAIDAAAEAIALRLDSVASWAWLGAINPALSPVAGMLELYDATAIEAAARWLLEQADDREVVASLRAYLHERRTAILTRWGARGGLLGRLAERLGQRDRDERRAQRRAALATLAAHRDGPSEVMGRILAAREGRRPIPGVTSTEDAPTQPGTE